MKYIVYVFFLFHLTPIASQTPTKKQIKQVKEAQKEVRKMKGKAFPAFELVSQTGDRVSSENIKDRILVVNFWFTRCKPCIMEMSELNKMVAEFKNESVLFIAPTFDTSELVGKFLTKRTFDYDILPNAKNICVEMKIQSYPTHFIVNKDGIIEQVIIGYSPSTVNSLRKSIRKILGSE